MRITHRWWVAIAALTLVGGCAGFWVLPGVQKARQAARQSQFL